MFRFGFSVFFLSLAFSSVNGDELIEHLKGYEGRWVGHFTVHSTANGFTETFPVEQQYWWDGDKLRGLAVSQRDSGMEAASSETYLRDDILVSEISRGKTKEVYHGVLHEDGLLWLPSDMKRSADHQMRETLVELEDGRKKLLTDGFDTYVFSGGLAHIVFKGELTRQAESED